MSDSSILLSINPRYAKKIFEGTKTVELRRVRPREIKSGSLGLIYVSSPIKSLAGAFTIKQIAEKPLRDLWEIVKNKAGVTLDEYYSYYYGISTGVGIFFDKVWHFSKPLELSHLEEKINGFHPPQSFRYATLEEMKSHPLFKKHTKSTHIHLQPANSKPVDFLRKI